MKDHTKKLHPNTVAFACLEPQAAILIVDVIGALGAYLRWRPVAVYLLAQILSRLAESGAFERTHEQFSATFWAHLSDSTRKEKFSKWLKKLRDDMALSNCPAVRIPAPGSRKNERGEWRQNPTMYIPGIFWNLFRRVQDEAMKCDLMRLDVEPRRAKVFGVVADWLKENGATPIERVKSTEQIKPAKPSLPCACACASCVDCAAKQSAPSSLPSSDLGERITKQTIALWMDSLGDQFFENGADWANLGLDTNDFWQKIANQIEIADQRLKAAIKRHNAPRRLKTNGGQSK